MDARLLTRLTNVALVAVVGMTSGHLLMPARPAASTASRAAFALSVALTGSLAAWRERSITAEYHGRPPTGHPMLWLAGGAGVALLLAAVAWYVMHG